MASTIYSHVLSVERAPGATVWFKFSKSETKTQCHSSIPENAQENYTAHTVKLRKKIGILINWGIGTFKLNKRGILINGGDGNTSKIQFNCQLCFGRVTNDTSIW